MNENDESQTGAVVVGVDGSVGASAALRWAVAEARLRKTRLRVVHAWTVSFSGLPAGGYGYLGGPLDSAPDHTPGEMHAAAEALLDRVTADVGAQGLEIERQVVEGGPAEVLLGAVTADDLLVVGSRGHGGFVGLLLGSVSQQCAHHAPCPVVIVHAGFPQPRPEE